MKLVRLANPTVSHSFIRGYFKDPRQINSAEVARPVLAFGFLSQCQASCVFVLTCIQQVAVPLRLVPVMNSANEERDENEKEGDVIHPYASFVSPIPLLTISSLSTLRACSTLQPTDSDIFICSYPKSGTTWLQHIVLSLLFAHQEETNPTLVLTPYAHVSDYAPFFEIDPHWEISSDTDGKETATLVPWIRENHERIGRRVFNTHLLFDMLPSVGGGRGKFIYVARSPLDVCVSFFHHLSHQVQGGYEGDFDFFFRQWLNGEMPYGPWDEHIVSFVQAFADGSATKIDNIVRLEDGQELLLLTYDDMLNDLPNVVSMLADLLDLDISTKRQSEMLSTFLFDNMKSNMDRFQPKSVHWRGQFSFLRQGKSGQGRFFVSEEQRVEFQRRMEDRKVDTVLSHLSRLRNSDAESVMERIVQLVLHDFVASF